MRIKVQACGICHSDALTKEGVWPGITFPRIPGHEVIGVIDAVGKDVPSRWQVGQRVGVGWHAWHCGYCDPCRRSQFFACQTGVRVTGVSFDGGYADYMIAPATGIALVPAELSALDAAPLMCAGLTTFNALRNSGAKAGDLVAILGIGGLGHLGVQFAARMGFRTVAIARGTDKEPLARQLGASHYIDSQSVDPAAELARLGGAKVVLATVTHGPAMSATVGGLAPHGRLMILGAADTPIEISPLSLIVHCSAIEGWYSGASIDAQDTLAFSAQSNVRSMNEAYPLQRAAEAYERMMSGKARFRVVLKRKGGHSTFLAFYDRHVHEGTVRDLQRRLAATTRLTGAAKSHPVARPRQTLDGLRTRPAADLHPIEEEPSCDGPPRPLASRWQAHRRPKRLTVAGGATIVWFEHHWPVTRT